MPKGQSPLSDADVDTLRQWIAAGAKDDATEVRHWAYVAPVKPKVPTRVSSWVRNPIDAFALDRMTKAGLRPSPEASPETLIRRLSLDLTGLPPTLGEVDAFTSDRKPNAYEHLVDRLLASPHFGERLALPWLDAARYADSNGFQQDGDNYQYVWRDWVVRAFNHNMPFDQFTVEQLAGDLLPNPTPDQILATAFNRCHMLNGEGGAIPEEQRNVVLFDRVDVTATTFLGLTMACARCHDHKYDPLTQRDYYSMLAYFNRVPESGVPSGAGQYRIAAPAMPFPAEPDRSRWLALQQRVSELSSQSAKESKADSAPQALAAWIRDQRAALGEVPSMSEWEASGPYPTDTFDHAFDAKFAPETDGAKAHWNPHPEWADGVAHDLSGENAATYLRRTLHATQAAHVTLSLGSDDGVKAWVNGQLLASHKVTRGVAPDQEVIEAPLRPGDNQLLVKIVNGGGATGFYFRLAPNGLAARIVDLLRKDPTKAELQELDAFRLANGPGRKSLKQAQQELADFSAKLPQVMVMSDAMPRKTHIYFRGNYEVPLDEVNASTPAALSPPRPTYPANRLGLARWIVSPENPLTARVQVNHFWQMLWGRGLVKTSENFGVQCEPPVQQALLDWLAVDFREHGWNVKRLLKMMVMSSTYRQSSRVPPALRERDPENQYLARGARFRVSSLFIRDLALATSGLLNPEMGGKPVYPYQPKGIWDGLSITKERDFTYPQSTGADLYRRSLYTFWRRTVGPANMFDAATRQACTVRPSMTSTPLHALTTLNDPTWVEAGRVLAQHLLRSGLGSDRQRAALAFRTICQRPPSDREAKILVRSLNRARDSFRANPKAASEFLAVGESPRDGKLDSVEHAALANLCLSIFNLDEALTRE